MRKKFRSKSNFNVGIGIVSVFLLIFLVGVALLQSSPILGASFLVIGVCWLMFTTRPGKIEMETAGLSFHNAGIRRKQILWTEIESVFKAFFQGIHFHPRGHISRIEPYWEYQIKLKDGKDIKVYDNFGKEFEAEFRNQASVNGFEFLIQNEEAS